MTEFRISVKNAKTASALRKLLNEMVNLEVEEIDNGRIVRGEGDTSVIAALCGSWEKNAPRRSADEIRKTAWQRKVR
ncbi:hypothetical protein [Runella sp.]|uniref:hypothetical protein n=1 Tax=Runella sp. TaxID=1960881 RepID=UPI00261B889B|nr:hypothetical protein [Runella sp.]